MAATGIGFVFLPRVTDYKHLSYPPLRIFRFSGKAFTEGVEVNEIDGVSVRIYTPEKTLADCFKYRNKIGVDTALEALILYRQRKKVRVVAVNPKSG